MTPPEGPRLALHCFGRSSCRLAHDVDHVSLDLWIVGVIRVPMVEPMLVSAFELFWIQDGGDDCQRLCSWSGKVTVRPYVRTLHPTLHVARDP
jgi:hypothetical protein